MRAMGLDHIDISVQNLQRSDAFYGKILGELGFDRVTDGDVIVWRIAGMEIGIREAKTLSSGAPFDRYAVGLHHLALRAETRQDVDHFHQFLEKEDIAILDAPADYPAYGPNYYAIFFADPDGMKLEFVYRTKS